MILDFGEDGPSDLGEVLWNSYTAARMVRYPELRALEPRPEWGNQDPEDRALWRTFAARLEAMYRVISR